MAAMELTSSLSEIISSLDTSKIPDKLHCPVCDKFLLNGYKSSCCDQAICENCYGEVSDHCPMCEHRPFSQDLCKPYKAIRNTAKAFLKTHEKKVADERSKAAATAETASVPTVVEPTDMTAAAISLEGDGDDEAIKSEPTQEEALENTPDLPLEDQLQPSIEVADEIEVDDDAVNLITEEAHPANETDAPVPAPSLEPTARSEAAQDDPGKDDSSNASQMQNMQNMMNMNPMFNGMDMSQMMQMMTANGMNMSGFNPMIAMQGMAMNPMSQGIFGAFGGPGAGMNGMSGMNMGMNFPANQGMYGAGWNSQNDNMWNGPHSNNPSDFGSNAGYGFNQQGNFNQHQYNGDFQNGSYGRGFGRGRGRGRGRGGFDRFDRGRGSFNTFSQGQQPHFQNAHEQQQYEIQNMQASLMEKRPRQSNGAGGKGASGQNLEDEASKQVDDEFAPGGQEEVQEALGGDYNNATGEDTPAVAKLSLEPETTNNSAPDPSLSVNGDPEAEIVPSKEVDQNQSKSANDAVTRETEPLQSTSNKQQIAEIYQEDSHASMPPPSAPLGPAAQFSEPVKDFGFRGRGHGRFGSKGRGPVPVQNGLPLSPAKATSQSSVSPKEPKTVGVVGAPTGPKAMREPPQKAAAPAAARGNSGGFQIMGRASLASHKSQSLISERSRSGTPPNLYNGRRSPSPSTSHRPSQHSRQASARHGEDGLIDRDRDRERKHRKSKRDDEDHEMQDAQAYSRVRSPGESRKSSHRSHREKDGHVSNSKHHASRSRRHEDENGDTEYAMDEYGISTTSSREDREHRSSKSSRHESRRDRHRESERDHGREERHRDRKRSRHDRDEDEPPDDEEERRRSRKHKTHHESNGRGSHRSSEAATPVAEVPAVDPHTLEREARNKERMLKEQQRREKASKMEKDVSRRTGGGSGRRVPYKYEDEVQTGMGEKERESARWR